MSREFRGAHLSRRQFASLAGAAGASFGLLSAGGRAAFAQAAMPNPSDIIHGISPKMIIHNAKLGVMETPLSLLREHRHTPKEILFNRFHFPHEGEAAWFATNEAPHPKDWTIRFDGLVERPRIVHLDDLVNLPQEKRVSVLQCAGNGRAYFAARQKVPGGQWHNGGMGNVEWEGTPFRPFLAQLKTMPSPAARWITVHAWDQPATPVGSGFAKSYHIDDPALDHAILALKMNGEPIPATHGGPVRLIVPGYYGNMNVKMLTTVLFTAAQSPSVFQSMAYRVPLMPVEPGKFGANDYTLWNSVPTYGHKIKSVIFSPLPEDHPQHGRVMVTGVAFNDGVAPITEVEVSSNGGRSWHQAKIETPESPWAWHHWSLPMQLGPGKHTLASRATDALGRTQPIDGLALWNPRGYEWNGVDRVAVMVG